MQTEEQTYVLVLYLIPAAAAAGVRKGEMGGTGLAVDAIGVGGVEPEPSPVAVDILPNQTRTTSSTLLPENLCSLANTQCLVPHSYSWQRPKSRKKKKKNCMERLIINKVRTQRNIVKFNHINILIHMAKNPCKHMPSEIYSYHISKAKTRQF